MTSRARTVVVKGQVSHRHEANRLLTEPGATVLVHRGVPRSVAMACPDGCGEQLTVNLDERAGPAWRHYQDGQRLTIFPSVWRDTGCKSHFIVWRSKIYWCDWNEELDAPDLEVLAQVRGALPDDLTSYVAIADALRLVPWAVLSACNRLTAQGIAVRGQGKLLGHFRRNDP
jgi:Family of unknown function (DUF6527)